MLMTEDNYSTYSICLHFEDVFCMHYKGCEYLPVFDHIPLTANVPHSVGTMLGIPPSLCKTFDSITAILQAAFNLGNQLQHK